MKKLLMALVLLPMMTLAEMATVEDVHNPESDGLRLGEVCYYGQRSAGDAEFDVRRVFGDGEFVVIAVYGAKTSAEVRPEIIYSVSGSENFSTPEVWTDKKLLDGVKTVGYEMWPTSIWPTKSPVDGRFWIVVKTKSQEWCGYNRFRVGLKGTDAVTPPLFFSGRVSGPRESDGVCADTKRIVFGGECRALMDQGREGGYEGLYSRRMGMSEATGTFDCLGATRFYSGKPQASFTATVAEAGTFVLSSSERNWAVAQSSLSVSGGYVVSDIESICDDDKSDFEAACKFGRCNCVRRISVSAASTVTFKHRTQDVILANRFHFFPRDRKSVAIDALFCRTFHVSGLSGSCEYIPGYVTGSGVYVAGETATFMAVPAQGESFDHWEVVYGRIPSGLDMTNSTLSFKVNEGMCGEMADEKQIVLRAVWKDRFYRDVLALPVGAATVAGNRLVQEGESVFVTLQPDKECTLRNWSDGEFDNLSRPIYVDKVTANDLVYAFFDGMPSAGNLSFDFYRVVPGEAVSFDTGLIGYAAKGLPSGLKYDKKTGKITGAAKKPTGEEGVTVKFTKKGEADVTMTVVVGPIPTINVTLEGDTEKCKVTGGNKAYLVGKKVSLQAKGPKGTAFVGWFKDGEPWPSAEEYLEPKIKYVMTAEDLNLVACFEKEKMSIDASALESASLNVGAEVVEGVIVVNVETQSGLKTLKVTKLPSGLKLKQDKKTGIWSVCGKPKKAGEFIVTLKATAKSGAVETLVVPVMVGEKDSSGEVGPLGKLPEWAVGSFEGMMAEEDDLGWRCVMSISITGDVTVKAISAGNSKVGTDSAKCKLQYKTSDGGYYFEYNDAYCHKEYTIKPREIDGVIFGVLEGEGNYLSADREEYDKSFGVQNVWSRAAGTALCPAIAKGTQVVLDMSDWTERGWRYQDSNYDLDGCILVLTYGQNGNMSVAFFENGATTASATASTVLVPYELSADGKTLKALASVVFAPKGRHPIGLALYFNIGVSHGVVYGSDFTLDHYYMENR